jgi:hypothetical protein
VSTLIFSPAPVTTTPQCAQLEYPMNGSNVHSSGVTIKWTVNDIPGLPLGYRYSINSVPSRVDLSRNETFLSIGKTEPGPLHVKLVPFGYNNTQPDDCPVWTFFSVDETINVTYSDPYEEDFEDGYGGWTVQGKLVNVKNITEH